MEFSDGLFALLEKAKKDSSLRKKILETQQAEDPALALCELSTELNCPVTVGEVFQQGQRYLAALEESCLGATQPRSKWGDTYGQFIASVKGLE